MEPRALKLHTVICSTRPSRIGPRIASWFHELAVQHGQFEALLIDSRTSIFRFMMSRNILSVRTIGTNIQEDGLPVSTLRMPTCL